MKTPSLNQLLLGAGIFFVCTKMALMAVIFMYPRIIATATTDVNAQAIIDMTNYYRKEHGLSELMTNPRLTQAAVNKARDILSQQYFNHTNPEGKKFSDWIREVGYSYFYVGENLAIDFDNNTDVFQAWLQSPTHKANIDKSQYEEIGVATITGKYNNHLSTVVVQLFGTRIAVNDSITRTTLPIQDVARSQFETIEGVISLSTLQKCNHWNNIVLIVIIALILINYNPRPKSTQAKRRKPTSNL